MTNLTDTTVAPAVASLKEAANVINWVPIAEVEAYFTRYAEMINQLSPLKYSFNGEESFLHAFGARLVIRGKIYDNVYRTWRHTILANIACAQDADIPFSEQQGYQSFFRLYQVNVPKFVEITHFAFILIA